MKRSFNDTLAFTIAAYCIVAVLFSPCANADVIKLPTVTVMADHSLSLVVSEIAKRYSRANQAVVNSSFVPQKVQHEQISEGAAADILITSKEAWIEDLKLQGLIDIHSQTKLAGDRLVLIGPVDSAVQSQSTAHFPAFDIIKAGNDEPNFILANPETLMEGSYSKEAIRNLGVSDDMEEHTLYVKRLDQMFDLVANQKKFGICFQSSILGRKDIKVIQTLPASSHKPIIYYAVVIAGDNMDQARNFMEYLKSSEVNKLFRKYGFVAD